MGEYKTIENINLYNQRTFMRVDFNVLNKDGSMGSTKRISASLKSIKYAINHGAKLILATHVQRPEGQVVEKWRTAPIKDKLESLLKEDSEFKNKKVTIYPVDDCIGPKVEEKIGIMNNGDILLLENLRFYPGEEEKLDSPASKSFVKELAKFIDVYVLDGFAVAHRAHASTAGLPLYLIKHGKEVAAGYLMKQELNYWGPIATGEKGGVAIIGGAKLNEKMKAAAEFPAIFDKVIIGGVVANVFIRADNYEKVQRGENVIGKSLYTEKDEETGKEKDYTDKAKEKLDSYKNIILPTKVILDNGKDVDVKDIPPERMISDVLSEKDILEAIKSAPRVVIFGTMGRYEDGFTRGTDQLVDILKNYTGLLKIGGGDAEKAFKGKINVEMSTGGGASIEYIIFGTLPGLEALKGNIAYFKEKTK